MFAYRSSETESDFKTDLENHSFELLIWRLQGPLLLFCPFFLLKSLPLPSPEASESSIVPLDGLLNFTSILSETDGVTPQEETQTIVFRRVVSPSQPSPPNRRGCQVRKQRSKQPQHLSNRSPIGEKHRRSKQLRRKDEKKQQLDKLLMFISGSGSSREDEDESCDNCGKMIEYNETYNVIKGLNEYLCDNCVTTCTQDCFVCDSKCNLLRREPPICSGCQQLAVSEEDVRSIKEDVLNFLSTEISTKFTEKRVFDIRTELKELLYSPIDPAKNGHRFGMTDIASGEIIISAYSGLSPETLGGVLTHEYIHAFLSLQNCNMRDAQREEDVCNLAALKYCQSKVSQLKENINRLKTDPKLVSRMKMRPAVLKASLRKSSSEFDRLVARLQLLKQWICLNFHKRGIMKKEKTLRGFQNKKDGWKFLLSENAAKTVVL